MTTRVNPTAPTLQANRSIAFDGNQPLCAVRGLTVLGGAATFLESLLEGMALPVAGTVRSRSAKGMVGRNISKKVGRAKFTRFVVWSDRRSDEPGIHVLLAVRTP